MFKNIVESSKNMVARKGQSSNDFEENVVAETGQNPPKTTETKIDNNNKDDNVAVGEKSSC